MYQNTPNILLIKRKWEPESYNAISVRPNSQDEC